MITSSPCPERDRLLEKAKTAILKHHELAMMASKLADAIDTMEFAKAQRDVSEAFTAAAASLDRYREHVQDHRCDSSQATAQLAKSVGKG